MNSPVGCPSDIRVRSVLGPRERQVARAERETNQKEGAFSGGEEEGKKGSWEDRRCSVVEWFAWSKVVSVSAGARRDLSRVLPGDVVGKRVLALVGD